MEKPNIVEVIGSYLPLRRAGSEYKACCPFHADKTPSFCVNEELGVFYCFGCQVSGDVIDFLMKWSGKSFPEVCDHLGIQREQRYVRLVPDATAIAGKKIHDWKRDFSQRLAICLCEIGQRGQLAKDIGWNEELQICVREWSILSDLCDDLENADYILELYESRDDLERILDYAS